MSQRLFFHISIFCFGSVFLHNCSRPEAPSRQQTSQPLVASATSVSSTSLLFGDPLRNTTPFVTLSEILKDPKSYEGKRVRTQGEVVSVCQSAGCWCDLKPEHETKVTVPTHVTMHNHAFFLPKTSQNKVVELEGTLNVRALSEGEVKHYNSEGASLTAGTPIVNIDALGVLLK